MGENSKIEWTTHTFNPWIGCTKVSPGCDHCYAESLATRYRWVTWGPHGERKRTSVANWRKPLQWAKAARKTGERPRVFCASLADVFDNQVPPEWRGDLFKLIYTTPELDWLLLTKRPENLARFFPSGDWPNVWLGTTCEDQERANRRIPLLLEFRRRVPTLFLSCEPLLGRIDLHALNLATSRPSNALRGIRAEPTDDADGYVNVATGRIDWVIVGGESGRGARPFQLEWADSLVDNCRAAGVACFVKQFGAVPISDGYPLELKSNKGGDQDEWPERLRVRQFPQQHRGMAA